MRAGSRDAARAGVLALQGDVHEHAVALREAGATDVTFVRQPRDLESIDVLVIPGGESTTIGRLMVEYGLDKAIQQRAGEGLAVFGTCAGLILLATEIIDSNQPRLGLLPARVRRNAYGRQIDSFEAQLEAPLVSPVPLDAVFIRAPWIDAVDDRVDVLARHRGAIVLCRYGKILAASFHPELTADRRLHRYLLSLAADGGAPS